MILVEVEFRVPDDSDWHWISTWVSMSLFTIRRTNPWWYNSVTRVHSTGRSESDWDQVPPIRHWVNRTERIQPTVYWDLSPYPIQVPVGGVSILDEPMSQGRRTRPEYKSVFHRVCRVWRQTYVGLNLKSSMILWWFGTSDQGRSEGSPQLSWLDEGIVRVESWLRPDVLRGSTPRRKPKTT